MKKLALSALVLALSLNSQDIKSENSSSKDFFTNTGQENVFTNPLVIYSLSLSAAFGSGLYWVYRSQKR